MSTVEKVIGTYFAAITKKSFMWKRGLVKPLPLVVRPNVRRGFICPAQCGACCKAYSLAWLPWEKIDLHAQKEYVDFNLKKVFIWHDQQRDNKGYFCRHLSGKDGRCGIHSIRPLGCDFELLRFMRFEDRYELTTKLYGRGWNMLRIDGERGAFCEILETDLEWVEDVVRRLSRLKEWTDHFGLDTWLEEVISYVRSEEQEPLRLEGRIEHAEVYA